MPTFEIAGHAGNLHVVDLHEESPVPSGAAPVVFVHGMAGHVGFWTSALAACADRRRAVAFDLRGHGASAPAANADYSIGSCAGDVATVLDELFIDRAVLVGHSFGAFVAIDAAARQPDRVRRLVLVDPPGDFTSLPADVRDGQFVPFLAAIASDGWRAAIDAAFEQALDGSAPSTAETIRARLAGMPREVLVGMYRSMLAYDGAAKLERYLATSGASARAIVAPSNAWPFSLHVVVPALAATVVPDVGHWVMLDGPQRFVAALESAIAGI